MLPLYLDDPDNVMARAKASRICFGNFLLAPAINNPYGARGEARSDANAATLWYKNLIPQQFLYVLLLPSGPAFVEDRRYRTVAILSLRQSVSRVECPETAGSKRSRRNGIHRRSIDQAALCRSYTERFIAGRNNSRLKTDRSPRIGFY